MNYLLSKKASNPASIDVPALAISLATKCFRSSLDDSAGVRTASTSLLRSGTAPLLWTLLRHTDDEADVTKDNLLVFAVFWPYIAHLTLLEKILLL